jgi:hypothetical protein
VAQLSDPHTLDALAAAMTAAAGACWPRLAVAEAAQTGAVGAVGERDAGEAEEAACCMLTCMAQTVATLLQAQIAHKGHLLAADATRLAAWRCTLKGLRESQLLVVLAQALRTAPAAVPQCMELTAATPALTLAVRHLFRECIEPDTHRAKEQSETPLAAFEADVVAIVATPEVLRYFHAAALRVAAAQAGSNEAVCDDAAAPRLAAESPGGGWVAFEENTGQALHANLPAAFTMP